MTVDRNSNDLTFLRLSFIAFSFMFGTASGKYFEVSLVHRMEPQHNVSFRTCAHWLFYTRVGSSANIGSKTIR